MSCSPLYLSQSPISPVANFVPISSILPSTPNSAVINNSALPTAQNNSAVVTNSILPTAHHNFATVPNSAAAPSSPRAVPTSLQIFVELNPPQPCMPSTHPILTRFKSSSLKPRVFSALCESPCSSIVCEPRSVKATLADLRCKRAMDEEHGALIKNHTWTLVPPPLNCNIVGHKWGFRIKYNVDGSISKYKARLVVKGIHHTPGVNFSDTFSLVIKPSTIRVIFTLADTFG
ncbi:hypothetical protein ACOSQ2_017848 [Xanthoceras sorbifolium]